MIQKINFQYLVPKETKSSISNNHSSLSDNHEPAYEKKRDNKLQEGWTRATYILKESHLEILKSIAYWERTTIKNIMDEILTHYFDSKNIKI